MSRYLDEARRIRAITAPHYNCAQGVLIPFAEDAGLDRKTAYALAGNFGSGMRRGATCGAVTGALMVLGLFGADDPATVNRFYQRFGENHDRMLECRDLLRASHEKGEIQKAHCDGLVFECVGIVEDLLREAGKIS
jgi:C_GCAxxG_C_C family probable redox protein